MFEKILVATDLSQASGCLVQCIAELKSLGLKQVVLAHVVYVANTPGLETLLETEAKPELDLQRSLLEEQGIETAIALELGVPAHDLNDLAQRHGVDAIIIGSRGRGLARSALGSVSFKVLQYTRHPVFLARIDVTGEGDQCHLSVCRWLFQRILFPTDFSDTSERAAAYLEDIVRETGAAVTLLHVLDVQHAHRRLSSDSIKEQKSLDMRRLEAIGERLEKSGSKVTIEWTSGSPSEEIVKRTGSEDCSLVVMGNQGTGLFHEIMLGSVAHEVARSAKTPVLFIPAAV